MPRSFLSVLLAAAVAAAVAGVAATAGAQAPVSDLARPPANARHFVIQSTGGKHGDSWSWVAPDGSRRGRESLNLRGQVWETDSSGIAGADTMPSAITIRGVTPQGDAAETLSIAGGKAAWKSPIDAGSANYSAPAFYVSQGGPIDLTVWFVEALLARPDKSLDLLPGGKARASRLTDLTVGAGATRQTITLWAHHRHRHLAGSDLVRRTPQVLRAGPRPLLAARGVRRRAEAHREGAGRGHGGTGARPGEIARQTADRPRRVHRRPPLRCRCGGVPHGSDRDRRQGPDRRGRRERLRRRCRPARR